LQGQLISTESKGNIAMSVQFLTEKPNALLAAFDKRISQTEPVGKITTWVKDGEFYTHKAPEWTKKAWFKAKISDGKLTFNIIKPKGGNIPVTVYGYYHGHLTETFLNHFNTSFGSASSSALPTVGDNC
jgi:hypothetical protein